MCLESSSIVKELIPEFYGKDPSFLTNKLKLNLGGKNSGTEIQDVVLPPWARGDPDLFLKKMREGTFGA